MPFYAIRVRCIIFSAAGLRLWFIAEGLTEFRMKFRMIGRIGAFDYTAEAFLRKHPASNPEHRGEELN